VKDVKEILIDETEPTVRQGAVYLPMWIVGLLGILFYWGCNYIDARGGHYNELVYEPYLSTNQLASFLPTDETMLQMRMGGQVYNTVCVACHQANGAGAPGQYPPLAGSEWVLAAGPNRIIRIPITGLSGPIKVKGTDWNLSMPALAVQGAMSDEQLAAVLTYVRKSWGNNAEPVTVEQVKKVRADLKGRADPHTSEELLKLPVE
jgi:mono/diheme cytochrome c family protein